MEMEGQSQFSFTPSERHQLMSMRKRRTTSLNDMRDMMASLPQLKEVKDKLSLHLTMAQKCMDMFESKKLPQSASVEQVTTFYSFETFDSFFSFFLAPFDPSY